MIRVIVLFVVLFVLFLGMIQGFRYLTGKQALALTKIAGYSILASSLAIAVMFILVILF
jgi:hypothetical protein